MENKLENPSYQRNSNYEISTESPQTSEKTHADDEVISLTTHEQELYQTMKIEHQKKTTELNLTNGNDNVKRLIYENYASEEYKPTGFVSFILFLLIIALVTIGLLIVTLLLVW